MSFPKITMDRLESIVKEEDLVYDIDLNDGELGLGFPDMAVWFNISEDVLGTYAYWRGELTVAEDIRKAYFVANDLNSKLLSPKILVNSNEDNNRAKIMFEHSVLNHPGMTDEQLLAQVRMEIGSFVYASEQMKEIFPHVVDWEEEQED